VAERLVAWLHGTPVATLTPGPHYRMTLEWRDEGIARWGRGSRALSVGLPLGAPVGPRDLRALDYFENILPEGQTLATMASLAGVRPADTFGILAMFGRDCAGAIMLRPESEDPSTEQDNRYLPATGADLRRLVDSLDLAPLAVDLQRGFRPSLAGFQRKALVGRAGDGTWQLPVGNAPSTWILKPDGPHATAANEATCLRLAAACGLEVPDTDLLDLDGLAVLAVKRYDRRPAPAGPVRIHQEDGCQATSTPPAQKYEEQGGPALRDFAAVLRDFGDPADVISLARRTAFNMAVGNADAHAKNFSLLHETDSSAVRLAPLYDVLSTVALELTDNAGRPLRADTHLGQRVGGKTDIRNVTAADIIQEAATWGIRRQTAATAVSDTLDLVISAAQTLQGDGRVLATIRQHAEHLAATEQSEDS
jgi:serine/threonine-protein kinase HipA